MCGPALNGQSFSQAVIKMDMLSFMMGRASGGGNGGGGVHYALAANSDIFAYTTAAFFSDEDCTNQIYAAAEGDTVYVKVMYSGGYSTLNIYDGASSSSIYESFSPAPKKAVFSFTMPASNINAGGQR